MERVESGKASCIDWAREVGDGRRWRGGKAKSRSSDMLRLGSGGGVGCEEGGVEGVEAGREVAFVRRDWMSVVPNWRWRMGLISPWRDCRRGAEGVGGLARCIESHFGVGESDNELLMLARCHVVFQFVPIYYTLHSRDV